MLRKSFFSVLFVVIIFERLVTTSIAVLQLHHKYHRPKSKIRGHRQTIFVTVNGIGPLGGEGVQLKSVKILTFVTKIEIKEYFIINPERITRSSKAFGLTLLNFDVAICTKKLQ